MMLFVNNHEWCAICKLEFRSFKWISQWGWANGTNPLKVASISGYHSNQVWRRYFYHSTPRALCRFLVLTVWGRWSSWPCNSMAWHQLQLRQYQVHGRPDYYRPGQWVPRWWMVGPALCHTQLQQLHIPGQNRRHQVVQQEMVQQEHVEAVAHGQELCRYIQGQGLVRGQGHFLDHIWSCRANDPEQVRALFERCRCQASFPRFNVSVEAAGGVVGRQEWWHTEYVWVLGTVRQLW